MHNNLLSVVNVSSSLLFIVITSSTNLEMIKDDDNEGRSQR